MQFFIFATVPAPLTIDAGSHKMSPGHVLILEKGQLRQACYWDLKYTEDYSHSLNSWAEEIRHELRSAVHSHLADCDPSRIGSFLSGGIDSSTVVAFASERILPLSTFSIFFKEPSYSEIQFARTVASRFHCRNFEECLLPASAYASISRIISAYDEPFANSSVFATYACVRLARDNGIDTLLAGDGGDELFAGNHHYLQDRYLELYHKIPVRLRAGLLAPLVEVLPSKGMLGLPRRYVRRASLPNPLRLLSYKFFLSTAPEKAFNAKFLATVPPNNWLETADRHYHSAAASNDLNRTLYLDMKMTIADNDLRKVMGIAEAFGIRVRFPFLDSSLAELAGRIPASLKLCRFQLRYVFKYAMKEILPPSVLSKKKHGFGVPIGLWLRNQPCLNVLMRDLLDDKNSFLSQYFQPTFLAWLVEQHAAASNPAFHGEILWRLIVLEMWHQQQHIDKPDHGSSGTCGASCMTRGIWQYPYVFPFPQLEMG
jgi:asparagine synthase (glutamine-hydrolysing)